MRRLVPGVDLPVVEASTARSVSAMELNGDSIDFYVRHAFRGMDAVLDRLDDDTVIQRPAGWGTNSVAGLIVD